MPITIWTGGTETVRPQTRRLRTQESYAAAMLLHDADRRVLAEHLTEDQQAFHIDDEVSRVLTESEYDQTSDSTDRFWLLCRKTYALLKANGYYSEARQLNDLVTNDTPILIIWDYMRSLPKDWTWKQQDPSSLNAVSGGLVSPR